MFKILGTDDAVNTCDCCGKSNLKSTVIVEVDGEVLHYGSVCATRHTKLTGKEIKHAIKSAEDGLKIAAQKAFRASVEYSAAAAKMNQAYAQKIKPGREFMEFCKEAKIAADTVAVKIAAEFGVEVYQVY